MTTLALPYYGNLYHGSTGYEHVYFIVSYDTAGESPKDIRLSVWDEKLTPEEFQLFFLMLIAAGNESTRSVTAHGMRLLMEHPDQLQMLVDNPELIPDACEEMLRYNPAFVTMRRTVMEDTEVSGVKMKTGDKVLLHWHLINQDESVFDDPMTFDITRAQRQPELSRDHRSFGIGTHYCLGAHLALRPSRQASLWVTSTIMAGSIRG